MAFFIREEETLDRQALAALQRKKLAAMLNAMLGGNSFYRKKFDGLSFDAEKDPLTDLPFTTRSEIQQDQSDHPPYGTNLSYPLQSYVRLHQTSGSKGRPICWLDRAEDWAWWRRCWGMLYGAAGIVDGDRFLFPFSFGPFIGFWAAFEAAVAMEHLCLSAGGMSTTARLRFMLDNDVTVVLCTPTYALRMAEVAAEEGLSLAASKVRCLIVAGEPGGSIPATRAKIESSWGARVIDHPGMTETGPHSIECVESPGGVHIIENEFIAEVIDPETTDPVADGESGELVITNLGRWGSPVIRYRTGDCVRMTRDRCACGRWFAWLEGGVLGRLDDMVIIRGNNVYPAAVEAILRRFEGVAEFRMEVVARESMNNLRIEIEPAPDADRSRLTADVSRALRDGLNFRPEITLVEPGDLPRFEMKARRLIHRDSRLED
jgi:phenylacetate-CoA ligase